MLVPANDELSAMRIQLAQRAFFVDAPLARIACDIGCNDRCEPAFS